MLGVASATYAFVGVFTPSSPAIVTPAPASGTATPTPARTRPTNRRLTQPKSPLPDRTGMLLEVVGRSIVPILEDVYAASVITTEDRNAHGAPESS